MGLSNVGKPLGVGKCVCAVCGDRCGGYWASVLDNPGYQCTDSRCRAIVCNECVGGWLVKNCPLCNGKVRKL